MMSRKDRLMQRMALPLCLLLSVLLAGCSTSTITTTPPSASPTEGQASPPPLSVYLNVQDSPGSQGYGVFALRAADGKVRWHYSIKDGKPSAPVLDKDTVYVSSNDQHLYALNASDGSLRWQYQLGKEGLSPSIYAQGLIVAGDVVYVASSDNVVTALNASIGTVLWRTQVVEAPGIPDIGTFLVVNGLVYVGPTDLGSPSNTLTVLSASDGSVRWRYQTPNGATNLWASTGDQVYVEERQGGLASFATNTLHVLNAQDGKEQWSFSPGKTQLGLMGIESGTTYILSDKGNTTIPNVLYALNTSNGAIRWQSSLQDPGSLATFTNGTIFTTAQNNYIASYAANDGKRLWHVQIAPPNLYTVIPAVVADADDAVYLYAYAEGLYALNSSDGSLKWRYQSPDALVSATVVNSVLYGATQDQNNNNQVNNYVYALNSSDGSPKWRYDVGVPTPSITAG